MHARVARQERKTRVEQIISSDGPGRPWPTVCSDLFELNGSNYLLVVDYLSAFVEIATLNNTSSASIMNNLNPYLHGMEFQKLLPPTMVRMTRHSRSVRSLMFMNSFTEQAVQDTRNQTEFLREL